MKNRVDKYLHIMKFPNPGKKTNMYGVYAQPGLKEPMGTIKWYGGWRKYVYHPVPGSFLDSDGCRWVAGVLEALNKNHRQGLRSIKDVV